MPADTTYALSALPVDNLGWGETYASSAKLCLIGGSIPVTVWTVGIIDSLWFFTRGGDPAERVTVGVVPLTEHAMMVGRNILSRFSRPVSGTSQKSYTQSHRLTRAYSRLLNAHARQCISLDVSAHGW